jgi:hypothetical protein
VDRIDFRPHVDAVGLEPLGLGRDDDAVAFIAAGLLPEPAFGPLQVAGDDDGVAVAELCVVLPGTGTVRS